VFIKAKEVLIGLKLCCGSLIRIETFLIPSPQRFAGLPSRLEPKTRPKIGDNLVPPFPQQRPTTNVSYEMDSEAPR